MFLKSMPLALVLFAAPAIADNAGLVLGPTRPFSWEQLIREAEASARREYKPVVSPAPEVVEEIDYDAHGRIRFSRDMALFRDSKKVYPVTFFALGRLFKKPVLMNMIDGNTSREVMYSPTYFTMPENSPARRLPPESGFAGFQLKEDKSTERWFERDWVAFLGASYFRAVGELDQYGISARGLAIDTGAPHPEEFPDFTEIYIDSPERADQPVTVYACLEGPLVSGAYRFLLYRTKAVIMEIDAVVFTRKDIHRLGFAPLTSMFWYGEYNKHAAVDWRPEVHDSDGLAIWTGSGERIWRPLNNPHRVMTNTFMDKNPKGFGLLQRDRNSENYLDGINYELLPSLWVEPLGEWGEGSVQLVEIPTDDEIHDNIVAMWVPKGPVLAGQRFHMRYRLHWTADEPHPALGMAQVVATRLGRGGHPGVPRPAGVAKHMVEFAGPSLEAFHDRNKPQPVLWVSRGKVTNVWTDQVPRTKRWRVQFNIEADGSAEPVDMRLYLKSPTGEVLTETWLHQFHRQALAPYLGPRVTKIRPTSGGMPRNSNHLAVA